MKTFGRVGLVGRFKPLHNGGALMLESICEAAEHVVIGIGSSNKYDARNPFTAEESRQMIDQTLSKKFSNYSFVFLQDYGHIPEFADGSKWKSEAVKVYGNLDAFVSGNEYVKKLLEDEYKIVHPSELIPKEKWLWLNATMVRVEMARGDLWKKMVPEPVANYLQDKKLIERFRQEFGLQTLVELIHNYDSPKNLEQERQKVVSG